MRRTRALAAQHLQPSYLSCYLARVIDGNFDAQMTSQQQFMRP